MRTHVLSTQLETAPCREDTAPPFQPLLRGGWGWGRGRERASRLEQPLAGGLPQRKFSGSALGGGGEAP